MVASGPFKVSSILSLSSALLLELKTDFGGHGKLRPDLTFRLELAATG